MTHIQALERNNSPQYQRLKQILSRNNIDLNRLIDYNTQPDQMNSLGTILCALRRSENSRDALTVNSILSNNSEFLKERSAIKGSVAELPFAVLSDDHIISGAAGITFGLSIAGKTVPIALVNADLLGESYQFEEYMKQEDAILKVATHEMIHANTTSLTGEGDFTISGWTDQESETLSEGLTESLSWLNTSDLGDFESNMPVPAYTHFVVNALRVFEKTAIEKSKYRDLLSDLNSMKADEAVKRIAHLTNLKEDEFKKHWLEGIGYEFEIEKDDLDLLETAARAAGLRENLH